MAVSRVDRRLSPVYRVKPLPRVQQRPVLGHQHDQALPSKQAVRRVRRRVLNSSANRNRDGLAALVLEQPAKDQDYPRDQEPPHVREQLAQDALVLRPVWVARVLRHEPAVLRPDATPLN